MVLTGETMAPNEDVDPQSLLKQIERGGSEEEGSNEEKPKLKCNFCNKDQKDVKHLVAGPDVHICNECIGFCNEILYEQTGKVPGQINLFVRKLDGRELHLVADLATKSVRWCPKDAMSEDPMSMLHSLLSYEETGRCPNA